MISLISVITILDKLVLLMIGGFLDAFLFSPEGMIVPLLAATVCHALGEYLDNDKVNTGFILGFSLYSIFFPEGLIFLPLVCYDILKPEKKALISLVIIIPFLIKLSSIDYEIVFILAGLCVLTVLMRYKSLELIRINKLQKKQRDDLTEISYALKARLKNTMTDHEYELKNAALGERNRIAREIHDNVGHLLSSSILQLGAIMAIEQNPSTKALLKNLQSTLNDGMNSIRASVHDLRDESVDLYTTLFSVVKDFTFCKASLKYEANNPPSQITYTAAAIVKESLANVIKHSNATEVSVSFFEHPAIYQLIIHDNGTSCTTDTVDGMGLENIRERVSALGGICNISADNGFRVFTSFPKNKQ